MKRRTAENDLRSQDGESLDSVDLGAAKGFDARGRGVEVGAVSKGGNQLVRGDDRVAQCDVDSLGSDGGHRMRGATDQKRARRRPADDAIRDGTQQEGATECFTISLEMRRTVVPRRSSKCAVAWDFLTRASSSSG